MTDQNQYQGVSNPPDNGDVTSIDTPGTNDSTVAQTAVNASPNPTAQAGQTPPANQPQPQGQTPQAQAQSASPDQNTQGGKADLSKAPQQPQPQGSAQPVVPPQVKKASMFHDIAETLAGGPRYQYKIDEYGNQVRQKIPVSNAHLALAIAMEAIGGGITGLANGQGPNGLAKAASAAYQQGNNDVTQQDQQARKQATEDFSNRAQVTENNMRMYNNALTAGRMNEESVDKYVDQYADMAKFMMDKFPGYVHEAVGYQGLQKYNATQETAIPYKRVARVGADGQQVKDHNGVPQWDIDYLVIDPKFKATMPWTDADKKSATEMGLPWANTSSLDNTPLAAVTYMQQKSRIGAWELAKHVFSDFSDTVNKAGASPSKSDENDSDALATKYAQANNTDPNYIRALIKTESGGKSDAVSPTGAKGYTQLTSATAKELGVDRDDPEDNVKGGTQLFSQLLNRYKDPRLAYAAYYSGPGAIQNGQIINTNAHTAQDTTHAVNRFMANLNQVKVTPATTGEDKSPVSGFQTPDMGEFTKENPTFPTDLEKFMGAYNALPSERAGLVGDALAHLQQNPDTAQSASRMAAFLTNNGQNPNAIKQHDDYVNTQTQIRKDAVQTQAIEDRANNKANKDTEAQKDKQAMLDTLESAKIPDNVLQMDPKDVISNLSSQGVTLAPSTIRDAMAIARYEAPISIASNKLWFKDKSPNQQDILDVVRQFNPSYNVDNYKDLHTFKTANSNASKTFQATAAVSNHLNMLLDLASSVKAGATDYPLLNKLENSLNYHTGGSDYSRMAALTNAINGEMGKVLSGGFAPQKEEVDALMKNMTPENSYKQIHDLVGLYTGVMHGKAAPYDEQYNQMSGAADKHLENIPKDFTKLVQRYGYETPWEKNKLSQVDDRGEAATFKPNDNTQYQQISKDGKVGIANGKRYVIATGQPL